MSEPRPVRLRLSRARGFDLQAHSRAVNGLSAVNCARPSKWGNPYKIGTRMVGNAEMAVAVFKANLPISMDLSELRGKNLACFCALPKPGEPDHCHAACLLELIACEFGGDNA